MLWWLAILGCGGGGAVDDPPLTTDSGSAAEVDPCAEGALGFTPGIGPADLSPVDDGDVLVLVQGLQGGFHVDLAGQVDGATRSGVVTHATLTAEDGVLLGESGAGIQSGWTTYDAEACVGTYTDGRLFILAVPNTDVALVCGYVGVGAVLDLRVEDLGTGRSASASRRVVLDTTLYDGSDCPE